MKNIVNKLVKSPQRIGIFVAFVAILVWVIRRRWISYDESIIEVEATKGDLATDKERLFKRRKSLKTLNEGSGPLYYRSYQVAIARPKLTKSQLFERITSDLNQFVPWAMLSFRKTNGDKTTLQVGDEYIIYLLRLYQIAVRVSAIGEDSFSFFTLQGHIEAGEIQFSLLDHPEKSEAIVFEITARFRSGDPSSHFLYRVLGVSKLAQTWTWVIFCHFVAQASGGKVIDKIHVMTHRVVPQKKSKEIAKNQPWQRYQKRLEKIRTLSPNFDINKRTEFTKENGWNIDDYQIGLPGEKPGMPEENGSWQQAKAILLNYEFPDPSLITGIFVPDDPIDQRVMLLRARFLLFTFWFNVKISSVIDEQRESEQRGKAQVWGFSYMTLSDHFEMGEITFSVWKFLKSGEVEFHIHSYSKAGRIRNPFYRIGFKLFGRRLQKHFAHTSMDRMQKLVIQRIKV